MTDELHIDRGMPTDEELAALVGVLLLRGAARPAEPDASVSRWSASARPGYAHRDGRPARPGRDAWRSSTLPR